MKQERTITIMDDAEGHTIREEWKNEDGTAGIGQIYLAQVELDSIYAYSKLGQITKSWEGS